MLIDKPAGNRLSAAHAAAIRLNRSTSRSCGRGSTRSAEMRRRELSLARRQASLRGSSRKASAGSGSSSSSSSSASAGSGCADGPGVVAEFMKERLGLALRRAEGGVPARAVFGGELEAGAAELDEAADEVAAAHGPDARGEGDPESRGQRRGKGADSQDGAKREQATRGAGAGKQRGGAKGLNRGERRGRREERRGEKRGRQLRRHHSDTMTLPEYQRSPAPDATPNYSGPRPLVKNFLMQITAACSMDDLGSRYKPRMLTRPFTMKGGPPHIACAA